MRMNSSMSSAGCCPSESMVRAWVYPAAAACSQSREHRRALAAVFAQHDDLQARAPRRQSAARRAGESSVLPSITTHTGFQLRERRAHRSVNPRPGVVARDEHEVRRRRRPHESRLFQPARLQRALELARDSSGRAPRVNVAASSRRIEPLAEAHPVDDGQGRAAEQGPPLAEERRIGLDDQRLNGHRRTLGDQVRRSPPAG